MGDAWRTTALSHGRCAVQGGPGHAHLQGFGSGIVRFLRGVFTVGNFNLAVKAAMVTNILSHLDRLVFIALRT